MLDSNQFFGVNTLNQDSSLRVLLLSNQNIIHAPLEQILKPLVERIRLLEEKINKLEKERA